MQAPGTDIIEPPEVGTLDNLFVERVRRSGKQTAYRWFDRAAGGWCAIDWEQMGTAVARWRAGLAREGLEAGDRVALVLRNCPEWVQFDLAALSLGLADVPLYTDDRADNMAFILADAGVRLLLVQDEGRWRNLVPALDERHRALFRVLILHRGKGECAGDSRVRYLDDWLPPQAPPLEPREGDSHALASIVYTSGTTGRPKGVMLSHRNMLMVAHGGLKMVQCQPDDLLLSFLPLSHTLERTAGLYLPIMCGACVAYARSVAQLAQDFVEIRPTVIMSVPRVFERVYGRMQQQLESGKKLPRLLFRWAVELGWRRFELQQGRGGWSLGLLVQPLLDRLVGAKLRARMGGRLRIAVSGGAPLSTDIARVFIGLGVPILQGYGLTETAPVLTVNALDRNQPASVGLALDGVELRLGEQGELLARTPGCMLGYWNNPEASARMIDADGWLHTGDQARIDADGHVYITGRIKDILVLSNGEKVPPADMEMAIALNPLIDQVMVVGEGRPYLTAILVLNPDSWPALAERLGLDPADPKALEAEVLKSELAREVRSALTPFPGYGKIRRLSLTLEPWTLESGMLTPTMKIKRNKVIEHHAAQIEAMYDQGLT